MLNRDNSSSIDTMMVDGISRVGINRAMSAIALNKIKTERVRVAPQKISVVTTNSSPNLNYARSLVGQELVFEKHLDKRLDYWYKNHKNNVSYIPKIDLGATEPQELADSSQSEDAEVSISTTQKKAKSSRFSFLRLGHKKSYGAFKYIGLALASFAFFYGVFNYPVVKVQSQYFYNQLIEAKHSGSKDQTALVSTVENNQPVTTTTKQDSGVDASSTNFEVAMSAPAGNRILIPSINVEAPIIFEPSREEEAYQKALGFGVVHYAETGMPGEPGNMVIGGHSSSDWWRPGNYKFIFVNLDKLKVGDRIEVNYNQKKYIYQVEGSKIVEPTDLSVIAPTSNSTLTLFTCTPPGTNWKRLIISSKLIEPMVKSSIVSTSKENVVSTQSSLPGSTTQTNFVAKNISTVINFITKPLKKPVSTQQRFALPTTLDV